MKKQKFPLILPKGCEVRITQYFTYDPVTNPLGHSGIDFIPYDPKRDYADNQLVAYGSKMAMGIDTKYVRADFFGAINEKGNGVRVEWQDGEYFYQALFWHTCWNIPAKEGDLIKAGTVIGKMGNAGYVLPAVTPDAPANGTHCHFSLQRMRRTQWGNTEVVFLNPLDYFDVNDPVARDEESIITEEDTNLFKWAFDKSGITSAVGKLIYLLTRYKIK